MAERSIADALYADAQQRLRRQINERALPYGWAIIDVTGPCLGRIWAPRWVGPDSYRNDLYPVLYDSIWELANHGDDVAADAVEWLRRNCHDTYRRLAAGVPDTVPLPPLQPRQPWPPYGDPNERSEN